MPKKLTRYRVPDTSREEALEGIPLASFSRRALALLLDFLIAGICFMVITVGGGTLLVKWGLVDLGGRDVNLKLNFFGNWYSVVWLAAYFTLGVYWGRGRTWGKKICRIRVVSLTHERISFWHSLERALGYGASALEAGFGFIQYFLRKDRQTVHDRIAETIVVSDSAVADLTAPSAVSSAAVSATASVAASAGADSAPASLRQAAEVPATGPDPARPHAGSAPTHETDREDT